MRRMNSSIKRSAGFLLLFAAVYILWGMAVYYGQYVREHYQSVSIRLKGSTVAERMLAQIAEQEKESGNRELAGIAAWNQKENQFLECDVLGTKAEIRLIEVYGAMENVYPIQLLSGYIPAADDTQGCLIDEDTAYRLFHTVDSLGSSLIFDGRRYYVRGILRSFEEVCLIIRDSAQKSYSNLELAFEASDNSGQLAADLLRQYGISGRYTLIDGYLISRSLTLIYLLPAWLLGFCLLYDLTAVLWRRRRIPLQAVGLVLVVICLWPLLSWMMEFKLFLPQQLIPTQWSDFSFWSRKYAAFLEWKEDMAYIDPNYKDILLKQYIRGCVSQTIIAVVGMLALIIHERMLYFDNHRAGRFLLAALVEGAAVYLLFAFGKIFTIPRAYLGMPIFYMLAVDCFRWGKERIRSWRESLR
jgi:hypothetical protein